MAYVPKHAKPAPEPDPELLEAITQADVAVQENPELAFPQIIPTAPPDPANDPTLLKIRRRRWPITIAIILAIIVISGAITYYVLYNQALEREANRAQSYALLDQAIALIQESDPEVIGIDTAVKSEVTEADLPGRQVLIDKIPATQSTLDSAIDKANQALGLAISADDKQLVQHVLAAATNRQEMLNAGGTIIETDIKAMNSALVFGQAWSLIVTADTDMRTAAPLSGSGNYNDALQAIEANKVVLDKLNQALPLINQAQQTFAEADLRLISDYLNLKLESVQIAIESDQALVDADLATAQAKNQEFRDKDNEVVAAAAKLPAEPLALITNAYDRITASTREIYDSARANAADADVFIREYTGIETQTAVQ